MSDYVPTGLRDFVAVRAQGRCEYCRYPQAASFLTFEIEHIIARKHGGQTVESNHSDRLAERQLLIAAGIYP